MRENVDKVFTTLLSMDKRLEVHFYHTSNSQISFDCGRLGFSKPKDGFFGLDCWDIAKYALERLEKGFGNYAYVLTVKELPIEKALFAERAELEKLVIPNDSYQNKIVWVMERGAPGSGTYHPVILDYAVISNFKPISKSELEFMARGAE